VVLLVIAVVVVVFSLIGFVVSAAVKFVELAVLIGLGVLAWRLVRKR
jgi:hypothetical protein